jgi:hypothetical protein
MWILIKTGLTFVHLLIIWSLSIFMLPKAQKSWDYGMLHTLTLLPPVTRRQNIPLHQIAQKGPTILSLISFVRKINSSFVAELRLLQKADSLNSVLLPVQYIL